MHLAHPGKVGRRVRRVYAEEELPVADPIERHVVDDPAILVQQHAVAHPAWLHALDIVREESLGEGDRVRPNQADLAHVRYVEQPRPVSDGQVLLDDGVVDDGHLEAGKRGELRARLSVSFEQGRARQFLAHALRLAL